MNTKTHKILVVDDEPHILNAVEDLLEDDFEVITHRDASSALETLEQGEDVAVIITDQRMPHLSGHEFLSRAKAISGATKILFTGYADLEAVVQAVNEGRIYGYLAKPWDPIQFKAMISGAANHFELMRTLNKERALLHALMDNVPDGIYFKDHNLRFTRINYAYSRVLGLDDPNEAFGKKIYDFVSKCCADEINRDEKNILQTKEPLIDKVEKVERADKTKYWASTTIVPIADKNDSISGLVAITRDITERERFNRLAVDREQRMIELKKEINELSEKLGQSAPYNLLFIKKTKIGDSMDDA